tara:strand:+ start:342 stop:836 length:495 start_codon:yes stop_codon:yes gene_type:complete
MNRSNDIYNELFSFFEDDLINDWDTYEFGNDIDSELFGTNNIQTNKTTHKEIISEAGKKQLMHINYDPKIEKQTNCPIEQTPFLLQEKIIKLPCLHIFKKEPILKWLLNEKAVCPLCRHKLPCVKDKKKIILDMIDRALFDIDEVNFQRALENSLIAAQTSGSE